MAGSRTRIAVFIDWQNAYQAARRAFGLQETASWASHGFQQRLRAVPGVYHHRIGGKVFELVETPVNYAHRSS